MVILDTNIISDLSGASPNPAVLAWAGTVSIEELHLCTPVVAEMAYGAERHSIRTGSLRFRKTLESIIGERFYGRILPFSLQSALLAGRFRAIRERAGRPVSAMDMAIAGIAAANNATLATRNVRDFDGLDLKLINPFEA
jgi:toxin FitB